MSDAVRSLLLAGVGGQGVVLASMIVAEVLGRGGYDVKQSEVHGMAQRGGSVFSHIRFGEKVESPLVPLAAAEVMAAFEWAEALRWIQYVRPGGTVVADVRRVVPPGANRDRRGWLSSYPVIDTAVIRDREAKAHLLDAAAIATELGNVRAANSVVLGALAAHLDLPGDHWESVIADLVPRGTADVNLAAFKAGAAAPAALIGPPVAEPSTDYVPATIEVDESWCKGCDICSRVCPEFCFSFSGRGTVDVVAGDACTGCRLCEMLCPDFAITIRRDGATADPVPIGVSR
ncbi:MAG: 2-oxoacid:acceptor oxidoreductase family protein [Acidimicrobiia bacterium]